MLLILKTLIGRKSTRFYLDDTLNRQVNPLFEAKLVPALARKTVPEKVNDENILEQCLEN